VDEMFGVRSVAAKGSAPTPVWDGQSVRAWSSARGTKMRRGISLIEVIVCLMVLFILVGILLPSLHRVMRVTAPLVRCSNNLAQIHRAMTMYLADSGDLMPLAEYDPLREREFPPLNLTLGSYGVKEMDYWICPADPRPEVIRERWGSLVYPPGRLVSAGRLRIRLDHLGSEYPLLADRNAFHLWPHDPEEEGGRSLMTVPGRRSSPLDQVGWRQGHNALWANGKITINARPHEENRPPTGGARQGLFRWWR
jgi:type II secretory pathway pseudopilin PulG